MTTDVEIKSLNVEGSEVHLFAPQHPRSRITGRNLPRSTRIVIGTTDDGKDAQLWWNGGDTFIQIGTSQLFQLTCRCLTWADLKKALAH